jgi:hypothetical protein
MHDTSRVFAGVSLVEWRPVEQCVSTGRRLELRERRERSPDAGSAGREAKAAGKTRRRPGSRRRTQGREEKRGYLLASSPSCQRLLAHF